MKLDDFPKLWAALRNDDERAWVAYALVTGADVGDIDRAQPEDYDAAQQIVRVRGTKTETRDAPVPIMPEMRELFEFAHARLPLSWPRASKGVGEACKRAGLPHLSPKDLRLTAASWLVADGANISLVSRFLRHSGDTMVRKVYGQVTPVELRRLLIEQTKSGTETSQAPRWPLGEMAYAGDLKSLDRKVFPVRVREGLPSSNAHAARAYFAGLLRRFRRKSGGRHPTVRSLESAGELGSTAATREARRWWGSRARSR